MKIITLMNGKGGVGKTTTAINLAAQAALKFSVLIIDADSQSNLSANFGLENSKSTIRDAFLNKPFQVYTVRANLDVLPCSIDFTGIDLLIQNELSRELLLKQAINKLDKKYDFIFIDCPPDISLVTVNALAASDYVMIPIKADEFSMQGIGTMLDFIRKIKTAINQDLSILGILLTQYDDRLIISKNIVETIKQKGWDAALFNTRIRKNTAISNSQFKKQTIFEYDRKSNGALDYMHLGEEVLKRIKKDN